ncbi:MAG: hypothetical protein IKB51_05990 [Clostridia bacterium]|nr:hypothetical protein [Clostridia bacterium]
MPDYLTLFTGGMLSEVHNRYIAKELSALNKHTEQFGIVLSEKDCTDIAECRSDLLVENERIEVGAGAVKRIIEVFCDSGYVNQQNFRDTVEGLLECFYSIKTETEDKLDDETVLEFIKSVFENEAGGDVSKIYFSPAYDEFVAFGRKNDDKPKRDGF